MQDNPANNLEFVVVQDIENEEELEKDIIPIPFNTWNTPGEKNLPT